ncbi:MAG: hypothetical protein J6113_08855 [Lachnospiraceae bacterium]|nr:hypothetical protein [Lachnospiraceae bacterium]
MPIVGLIMFFCIIPALLIMFFQMYPKNWREKQLVFGVKNRPEFKEDRTAQIVDKISEKQRKRALIVIIATVAVGVLLFLLKGVAPQVTSWTVLVFLSIIAVMIPYSLGNSEMKSLKRSLGIASSASVTYTDLSNAGAVHALSPVSMLLPVAVGFVAVIVALLADLKVFTIPSFEMAGTFLLTTMMAVFWLTSVIITIFAFVMDNTRNEVISADSAINANYNRAKKKNFADTFVLMNWINTVYIVCVLAVFAFDPSDMLFIIVLAAYMLLLFVGVALFVARERRLQAAYQKEMTLTEDDDDYWFAGMFYYNPSDKRLNVEKRAGVGGTINMAHPAGKVITGILALTLIFVVLVLVWVGMLEVTPLKLKYDDGRVVCHQLRDDYVIDVKDIESAEYGENLKNLKLYRISGVGSNTELKGNFSVNGENGCKVFLWTENEAYIKIVTKTKTYYVNGATKEETAAVYSELEKALK